MTDSGTPKRAASPSRTSAPKRVAQAAERYRCDFCCNDNVFRRSVVVGDQEYLLCVPDRKGPLGPRSCAGCMQCQMHATPSDITEYTVLRANGAGQERGLVCQYHNQCVTGRFKRGGQADTPCEGALELVYSYDTAHWTSACSAHRAECPACGFVRAHTRFYAWESGIKFCDPDGERVDDGQEEICSHCVMRWRDAVTEDSSDSSEADIPATLNFEF